MNALDPWVFECPKGGRGMHYWTRNADMTATCSKCGLDLNVEQADRCFNENGTLVFTKPFGG